MSCLTIPICVSSLWTTFPPCAVLCATFRASSGFNNVVEADDGTTAWEVLNREKVEFIVSDWNMPQMTGIDLLRKVRASEQFADIPFLMVTAEAQQENIIEAVQAKVSNYIVKPFTADTMKQKIDKIFP